MKHTTEYSVLLLLLLHHTVRLVEIDLDSGAAKESTALTLLVPHRNHHLKTEPSQFRAFVRIGAWVSWCWWVHDGHVSERVMSPLTCPVYFPLSNSPTSCAP